jgi:cytochrome b involved in lipid metabolism|tara:strand:- start:10 stop:249 length:240 start_codon:yes stop_codon:yes gene_type:complete
MANNKNKSENKPIVSIDDVEYDVESFDNEQKLMVQHLSDLNRKIDTTTFNLQQLRFGQQAFIDALKASVKKEDKQESED